MFQPSELEKYKIMRKSIRTYLTKFINETIEQLTRDTNDKFKIHLIQNA